MSSSGFILFNELDSYKSLYSVFVIHFEASLSNWALRIYDGLSQGDRTGEVFHILSVIINMILMLNLVIAILSETYARLAPQRLGLYYDGLIASMPGYKFDKRYGILILLPPPFNVLSLVPILVLMCSWKEKALRRANRCMITIAFIPFAILYTSAFVCFNFLLIPFAYTRGVFHKVSEVAGSAFCFKS